MLSFDKIKNVYFIGIGGIGMSALARYFLTENYKVAGYDKVPSVITDALASEGAQLFFDTDVLEIPNDFLDNNTSLVVYTPAIPMSNELLAYFSSKGYKLIKRAEALGMITRKLKSLCVAGTHGKSTTSSMLAHILNQSSHKCNAFLGAIATNFDSNLLLNSFAEYTVVEADEFDRSFLQLTPFCSIITSADPDHLDIYGSAEKFEEGFKQYAMKIDPSGFAVVKEGLELKTLAKQITYAIDSNTADCSIVRLGSEEGISFCDCNIMGAFWPKVYLGLPGIHNAENALACIALLNALGVPENEIRSGLKSFSGLKRRFETIISNEKITFIDDYAHHPTEIDALISSLRMLYPGKKITGVFQPHLFSRTKDFSNQFSKSLSALDSLILLPIYPAREAPILGVSSELLLEGVSIKDKQLLSKEGLLHYLKDFNNAVLVTIGAGDIDRLVQPIKEILTLNLDL